MKMRNLIYIWLFVLSAACFASQFSPEDEEIFAVQSKLVEESGKKDYNFYKFLRLPKGPKSGSAEIEKHYKQLARKWHPDKFRDAKKKKRAEMRFQKLSLVIGILRNHEKKQRYDYYLNREFPRYNEKTGEYTFGHRIKPTLVAAVCIVMFLVSVFQYIILSVNSRQSQKRMGQLVNNVRMEAAEYEQGDSAAAGGSIPSFKTEIVHYNNKLFVVKPDTSVWYYNKPLPTPEDVKSSYQELSEAFEMKKEEKVQGNRRSRRAALKKRKKDEESEENEQQRKQEELPLVKVEVDDVEPVKLTQLVLVKLLILPFKVVGSIFKSGEKTREDKMESPKPNRQGNLDEVKNGKVKLDSGIVIGGRKGRKGRR